VNSGTLLWGVTRTIGDTVEVAARFSPLRLAPAITPPPILNYAWVELPVPAAMENTMACFMMWVANGAGSLARDAYIATMERRMALIDVNLKQTLIDQHGNRSFTGYAWRSICAASHAALSANPVYRRVNERLPGRMRAIAEDTAMAAFLEGVRTKAQTLGWINILHGDDMRRYNAEVAAIGEPPRAASPLSFALGVCGVVALGVYYWRRRGRGSNEPLALARASTDPLSGLIRLVQNGPRVLADNLKKIGGEVVIRAKTVLKPVLELGQKALIRAAPRLQESIVCVPLSVVYGAVAGLATLPDVLVEELIKSVPYLRYALPLMEFLGKLERVDTFAGLGASASSLAMHLLILPFPYWKRVALHLTWNVGTFISALLVSRKLLSAEGNLRMQTWMKIGVAIVCLWMFLRRSPMKVGDTPWEVFRKKYYDSPWEEREVLPNMERSLTYFPMSSAMVLREGVPYVAQPKPVDPTLRVRGTVPFAVEEKVDAYTTYIMPTNIPIYVPARTNQNLWAVARHRLLVMPPMDAETQALAWKEHELFLTGLVNEEPPIDWGESLQPWLDHIDDPRKLIVARKAIMDLKSQGIGIADKEVQESEVFPKTDEALVQIAAGMYQMKVRPITRVHPKQQANIGPQIYEATKRLHQQWPWKWPTEDGADSFRFQDYYGNRWQIRITFGSDATDALLSDWARDAEDWLLAGQFRAWILVGGDDSLVGVHLDDGKVRWLETDFSQFDQSQSTGPLDIECIYLGRLGLSPSDVCYVQEMHKATWVFRGKGDVKFRIKHQHRPERATGGPNTTSGNSSVNAASWMTLFREHGRHAVEPSIASIHMAKLGFKIKMKCVPSIFQATFLKGGWVALAQRPYWAPLPSRVLKLGKALTDPRTLYPTLGHYDACAQFLNDVAASYRRFVMTPGIRGFVQAFYKREVMRDLFAAAPWKVASAFSESPGTPTEVGGWAVRYGVDEQVLWDFDALVGSAQPFQFLSHPLCLTLAEVDYN